MSEKKPKCTSTKCGEVGCEMHRCVRFVHDDGWHHMPAHVATDVTWSDPGAPAPPPGEDTTFGKLVLAQQDGRFDRVFTKADAIEAEKQPVPAWEHAEMVRIAAEAVRELAHLEKRHADLTHEVYALRAQVAEAKKKEAADEPTVIYEAPDGPAGPN